MKRRSTIQRDLVLNAVRNAHSHVTADEVYRYIAQDHPTIGRGTVYRNLGILTEEGQIRKVEIPNGSDCFDSLLEEHYHIRCKFCGKVSDVDMETVTDLDRRIRDRHGFVFLNYDILFSGVCPECQKKNGEESNG